MLQGLVWTATYAAGVHQSNILMVRDSSRRTCNVSINEISHCLLLLFVFDHNEREEGTA